MCCHDVINKHVWFCQSSTWMNDEWQNQTASHMLIAISLLHNLRLPAASKNHV